MIVFGVGSDEGDQRKPRLDARRNREAALDAATELLVREPAASMQEIADASGLGRTTLYRHFPAREDLFDAMFERAVLHAWEAANQVISRNNPAETTLRELSAELIEIGSEFRFLIGNQGYGRPALKRGRDSPQSPVRQFLKDAQARGELRADLPLPWMTAVVQTLTLVAIEDYQADGGNSAEAKELLGQTLVDLLISRSDHPSG